MPSNPKEWIRKSSMFGALNEVDRYFHGWCMQFQEAVSYDKQSDNNTAITLYSRLVVEIEAFLAIGKTDLHQEVFLTKEQKDTILDIIYCLKRRVASLKNPENRSWMTLEEIKKLKLVLKDFLHWNSVFPILIQDDRRASQISTNSEESGPSPVQSDGDFGNNNQPYLLPIIPKVAGCTRLQIKLLKIGLKDAHKLQNPFIIISVRDSASVNLTPYQRTAVASHIHNFHLEYNATVEIQRYIEKMPKGSCIFFELRHTKNGKMKTKCFAVLRRAEFVSVKGFLELYKAPTDYHLKHVQKLSNSKPLFLHVEISVIP